MAFAICQMNRGLQGSSNLSPDFHTLSRKNVNIRTQSSTGAFGFQDTTSFHGRCNSVMVTRDTHLPCTLPVANSHGIDITCAPLPPQRIQSAVKDATGRPQQVIAARPCPLLSFVQPPYALASRLSGRGRSRDEDDWRTGLLWRKPALRFKAERSHITRPIPQP